MSRPSLISALALACVVLCVLATTARSQTYERKPFHPADLIAFAEPVRVTKEERADYQASFTEAYNSKDYRKAEGILRKWLKADPENFVPYYNLACTLAQQGKLAGDDARNSAAEMLKQAIVHGFSSKHTLITDPDLAPLRATREYTAILDAWDEITAARVEANLAAAKKQFGPAYTYEQDEARRLVLVSGFDPVLFDQAKDEITRLIGWWHAEVTPQTPDEQADGEAWDMVILPTRKDYAVWAMRRFGLAWRQIGGSYSHDEKTLVAQDLGSSMRHEFWHLLHWRDMERRGLGAQPTWVQEGLCSLVEDVRLTGEGAHAQVEFLPSWRTNIALRLAKMHKLTPWARLFAMDQREFVGRRPLSAYAQSRTVFMYLHARGKLRDWYAAYVKSFSDDPTGKAAFETVFAKPIDEVEEDFRAWVLTLPEVAEELTAGMATLPFEIDPGHGDGVVIVSTAKSKSGRQSGLRLKDVITSIDHSPIRDMNDYIRVMAEHEPGDEVEVEFRRASLHKTTKVELNEVEE